ncbi:oxidoreductase [Marinitoga arctica]
MWRINNLSLPIDHSISEIKLQISKKLNIPISDIKNIEIVKRSIDARKKHEMIYFVYSIDFDVDYDLSNIALRAPEKIYTLPFHGSTPLKSKPIIVGTGPAGLFAGLILAEAGFEPIILERGKSVDERKRDVNNFWKNGILNEESNVQFGEGGAGTFSDGKLNTLIKDKHNRIRKMLLEFVKAGAPEEILYNNKPHIGTDKLEIAVKNIRKKIEKLGGKVYFNSKVTDFIIENNKIKGVIVNNSEKISSEIVILAIGHSARDTFKVLHKNGIKISQKPFSIGVRIEHLKETIDKIQYGKFYNHPKLKAADYKLSHRSKNGRAVYTFCMCPGGYVVASASEKNMLVTNGMSEFARDNINSNSAILVSISPEDFPSYHPLAGVEFQRIYERKAFEISKNYYAPVQLFGDFLKNKQSKKFGQVKPTYLPGTVFYDLNKIFPEYISSSLKEGIIAMGKKMKGFSNFDALLTGVETRSSSPIRIERNENYESVNTQGLFPIGEGAGYAGGITSSAVDGIRVAESIISKYKKGW